jgi:hypothetical protein
MHFASIVVYHADDAWTSEMGKERIARRYFVMINAAETDAASKEGILLHF